MIGFNFNKIGWRFSRIFKFHNQHYVKFWETCFKINWGLDIVKSYFLNILELHDVSYILLIRRNLLYVQFLDRQWYRFIFGNENFELYKDCKFIGFGTLCDNLYQLDLFGTFLNSSLNTIVVPTFTPKHAWMNDKFYILWHKLLGHISRWRMKRLVKERIILNLEFSNLSTCFECEKGKLTSKVRKNMMARW